MVGRQVLPMSGKGRGLLTIFLVLIATCLLFSVIFFLSPCLFLCLPSLCPRPSASQIDYTGCSINPARSFGSSVISNNFKDHWVSAEGCRGGGREALVPRKPAPTLWHLLPAQRL